MLNKLSIGVVAPCTLATCIFTQLYNHNSDTESTCSVEQSMENKRSNKKEGKFLHNTSIPCTNSKATLSRKPVLYFKKRAEKKRIYKRVGTMTLQIPPPGFSRIQDALYSRRCTPLWIRGFRPNTKIRQTGGCQYQTRWQTAIDISRAAKSASCIS